MEAKVRQQVALQLGSDSGLRSGQAVHLINVGYHIEDRTADGLLRRGFCRLDAVMPTVRQALSRRDSCCLYEAGRALTQGAAVSRNIETGALKASSAPENAKNS